MHFGVWSVENYFNWLHCFPDNGINLPQTINDMQIRFYYKPLFHNDDKNISVLIKCSNAVLFENWKSINIVFDAIIEERIRQCSI